MRDTIIIGAGPSGLFCALHLPLHYNVLLLETSSQSAQKLLLSAKGRGNLTNAHIQPSQDYVTDNPFFVQKAFQQYGTKAFLQFLREHSFFYQEEENGRILLQSGKVMQFRDFLLEMLKSQGRTILYEQTVTTLSKNVDGIFSVQTTKEVFTTKNVILATGSKSIPKIGSNDIALRIAKQLGLSFVPFYPALVGLETRQNFSALAGSSVIGKGELYEDRNLLYQQTWPLLFTHRGISWPVVFNATRFPLSPETKNVVFKIRIPKSAITKRVLAFLGYSSNTLSKYTLTATIAHTRGFDEAKVCGGGILTNNLKPTFEVTAVPWLFIIGECLDVTGKTGGFNLQRCWTSAAVGALSF